MERKLGNNMSAHDLARTEERLTCEIRKVERLKFDDDADLRSPFISVPSLQELKIFESASSFCNATNLHPVFPCL